MIRFRSILLFVAGIGIGCRSAESQPMRLPSTVSAGVSAAKPRVDTSPVQPAAHEMLLQPAGVESHAPTPFGTAEPLPPRNGAQSHTDSLDEFLQLALATNPAIAQAEARVQALRGQRVQVGLPPNPTIGYTAEEMGDGGTAGKQGGFVGQQFITGGKLRLNRAVLSREIEQAEQRLAAMQLRVGTDVRRAFYAALIAHRRIELAEELLRASSQATKASQELLQAEEIPQAGLLQTQIEQQSFAIVSQTANNEQQAAWRQLSAVVGSDLHPRPLTGDVTQLPTLLDWDDQLLRVTTRSPEISAAFAAVDRAQTALERARAEPLPDVSTQATVQYDNATGDTVAGVQVGLPLPIWNRNQGGVWQAQAEVAEARRNAQRVEADLKRRLAVAYQQYANARAQAEIYSTQILPKSQETYELVQRGYRLGEIGYLDLLTAQRTYAQTNLAYLDALSTLWASWTEIDGLLLSGSLMTPSE
jgi:cobalt-zinc-cadmium efflux system outer membrane protein